MLGSTDHISDSGGSVRVCIAQISSFWEEPEKNLKKAEGFITHAARCGAQLICFPEQFATGWDPLSGKNVQDLTGSIITRLQTCAKANMIAVIGSLREAASPHPKNTSVTIGHDGRIISRYSKIHLFSHAKEDEHFSPGAGLGIFPLDKLICGLAICYDLRFPEIFRIYAKRGVQAIFVPSAWPASRIRHWELFIQARAAENQMYVIGVNTTGTNPVDVYAGGSMTADPDGLIIARAGGGNELLFSDVDPAKVEDARSRFPVRKDHRTELYHRLHQRE